MRSDPTDLRGLKPGLLGLAVVCALGSMQAQAVGLGGIEVKSKLNEPFVAEIPLNVDYSGQMDDMVVHLASPEEFERVGLERPHEMSSNLTFHVTRNARGEAVVLITTPQRMTDPYVSFLLEAEWGNGKMVREYTAMLEPPHMVEVPHGTISAPTVTSTPLPAPVVSAPVVHAVEPETHPATPTPPSSPNAAASPPPPVVQSVPEPVAPAPQAAAPEPPSVAAAPQPEAAPPAPQSAPEPAPPPVAETPPPPAGSADSITVAHGQTLSSIAGQMQTPGVSLNRVMIALQRANPEAFVGDNINRLKAGAVLRMPDVGQMQAITPDEANALVHEQVESWRRGSQPAPQLQPEEAGGEAAKQASSSAASSASNGSSTASKGRASATTSTAAVAGGAHAGRPHGAHLEILPPAGNAAGHGQSGSSVGGSGSELRAQLAQTKEELVARQAEITDLKAHVSDLEKIKTDSQKLLSMKDSQLAALQQRLAELEKKDAEASAAPASPASTASGATASAASPEASASTAASAASEATAGASPASTASGASSTAASTAATPTPAASPKKPAPPVHHAPPPAPQEPATPWYLQPFVLVGAGLILFGGLLGLLLRSQRKPEPTPRRRSFDPAALPSGRPIVSPNAITEQQAVFPDGSGQGASAAQGPRVARPLEEQAVVQDAAPPQVYAQPPAEPAPVEPEPVVAPVEQAPAPAVPVQPPPGGKWTVASRIEAARAYIENGDVDGARTMLEAALIEGNATQQEEAFKLLDMIDSW
ncbi:MAG TPA: FimV/HubP family polar landmark protein [Xanthomonadaceae bacterium]|jgi:pilus assembly protein FimV